MNWNDYQKYLKEGVEVSSLRQFHFLLVKVQTHWIASLGQTRAYFLILTALGFPLFIFGFYVVNYTQMGDFDTSIAPTLATLTWGMIYYPLYVLTILYPIYIIVSAITGAFFKEFWLAVDLIKKNIEES